MVAHTPAASRPPPWRENPGTQAPFSALKGGEFESPHGMEYRAGTAYTGIMRGNNLAVSRIDYYQPAGQRVWVRVGNGDYSSFATKLAVMSEQKKYSTDNPFRPELWHAVEGFEDLTDITYHRLNGEARRTPDVGTILLTGNGPSEKDGGWAFCSGGDQRIRGRSGYRYATEHAHDDATADESTVDTAREKVEGGRLHILEVQRLIRTMPKVVIAVVNGWAAGGGHSLHVVCDMTVASRQEARFKQTDADVGSFDAGYGSAYLAKMVGQKFAREIFFLGRTYDAQRMYEMGAVNEVVDHADLEDAAIQMGREINGKSPTAQRMLKFAFNLTDDGLMGQQVFAGEATRLAYMTDEAVEGKEAFLEKRDPQWEQFPYYY